MDRAIFSVMQLDGNSFGGDVGLNSFNKECRVEDSILDQICAKQNCSDFYDKDLSLYNIL